TDRDGASVYCYESRNAAIVAIAGIRRRGGMDIKICMTVLCAVMIAGATTIGASAQSVTKKRQYVATTSRTATGVRPRSRVVVAPRSFLDAGTEVRPGERKFTDYAYPPNYRGAT